MEEINIKPLSDNFPAFYNTFKEAITGVSFERENLVVTVKKETLHAMVSFLKSEVHLDVLMDLFAVDYVKFSPFPEERFAVIYQLVSLFQKQRLFLKVFLEEEAPKIDSIHAVFAAANWFEREAFDLFGIEFKNHPNLQRILCHQDFVGHPLRKDYPADGYQRLKESAPSSGF